MMFRSNNDAACIKNTRYDPSSPRTLLGYWVDTALNESETVLAVQIFLSA